MHISHEGVKMRPALARLLDCIEEHIHQHRLAAADWPMDVKAARRLGGLHAKQSREAARLALHLIALQVVGERVEAANHLRLCGIGRESALGNERTVAISHAGHARAPSPRGRRWPAIGASYTG